MNKFLKQLGTWSLILFILFIFFPTTSFSSVTDEGYSYGYSEGLVEGIREAEYDLVRGHSKNYLRTIPNNDEIIEVFKLDRESTIYKNAFIDGYKDGFRNGYNKTYRDSDDKDENEKTSYAKRLGFVMGEVFGYRDYYEGKSNMVSRTLPSNFDIIEIYDLRKETSDHRAAFMNAFKTKFQEGYEEAYRKAKFEPFERTFKQGKSDGGYFGGLLGDLQGKRDYYYGRTCNWKRNLPTRPIIASSFLLNLNSNEYEDAFVEAFIYAYEENYNNSFISASSTINNIAYENGYNHGKIIGRERGEGLASVDLLLGQYNDALRHMSTEYEIINEFELYLHNDKYREGFISGYNEGLSEGYIEAYQDLSFVNLQTKLKTTIIPLSGGEVATKDNKFFVKISAGTYYNDVTVNINGLVDSNRTYLQSNNSFIQASELYSITIANSSYEFDNNKSIELSFEYYGPQNGGIYKYNNNSWTYLPSKIIDNRIITYIRPSSINTDSGIYAVFIDKNFVKLKDIRGHWAKDEINAYVRRGLVEPFNDSTFRPDLPINRGQLLELLSRVYKWSLTGLDDKLMEIETLEDYDKLGNYKLLVAYGLKYGYIDLYFDNTFKVDNNVTYNQISYIMRKVTGDNNFNWTNVANSMVKDKDTRCKSYDSMDNTITRAEAIYMLYLLNE
ncbi:S-layer domain-containing protein [Proteiniborus sp. DW1]|uniref:S-layer homology domain-containing protein n=1 Tax=Proteiniborus sp. DW1 TaxID=1889883 RepID=UPI00092E0C1A|nr:S-layer homology domain-containing protein [Proteiniborus sp. DW1]SCG83295.1 S-layer domain-containing protein [Proteiniborus sp. DW1]